jgi:hypothetical protein
METEPHQALIIVRQKLVHWYQEHTGIFLCASMLLIPMYGRLDRIIQRSRMLTGRLFKLYSVGVIHNQSFSDNTHKVYPTFLVIFLANIRWLLFPGHFMRKVYLTS